MMQQNERSSRAANDRVSQAATVATTNPALEYLSRLMPLKDLREQPDRFAAYVREPKQEAAVTAIAQTLFRTVQRHAILVGESGTGRTTVLDRFADAAMQGTFPFLGGYSLVYLDVANVGPEDSRGCLETIFAAVQERHQPTVFFLDNFVSLFRRAQGPTNKALILALLSKPAISFVGTMRPPEYAEHVGNDAQLLKFFSSVDLVEPEGEYLTQITRSTAARLADEYGLAISNQVAERAVALTSTFILNEFQPAKSVDVLRRACDDQTFAKTQLGALPTDVTECDLIKVISDRTRIPTETISGNGSKFDYTRALGDCILGQSEAVHQVSIELQLIAAGLAEPNKPASVMMFAGTTGVGKTELAKRVAKLYSSSGLLKVYPMGNFTEAHSVSGLVGVPPGYVGYEEGGRLINDLLADPYSVFLLDEAEKCHPNVWKPFLNLFDEGWIIDQQGRKAYADRAIFILTTNAGDRSISQMERSGKSHDEIAQQVRKTLSRVRQERSSQPVFPPQFLSRMQKIIVFNPLCEASMVGIASQAVKRTVSRWAQSRHKRLVVSEELIVSIGRRASELNRLVNGEEGGRIINKLIRERVEYPILTASLESPDTYSRCEQIRVEPCGKTSEPHAAAVVFE